MRILVAEDNAVNQLVARRVLEHEGHFVTVVSNGEQAVTTAADGEFDIILMDIQMPGMNGLEATQAIRSAEQASRRRTPIIALTAGAMLEERERCLSAGMDDFLPKPVRKEELLARLAQFGRPPTPERTSSADTCHTPAHT